MIRSFLLVMTVLSTAAFAQEQQRFGVGTQFSVHGGVPVAGAEVIMPVNERLQMSYAFVQGKTDVATRIDDDVVTSISTADFALSEASVTLRWLATRSFYVGAGAGYRTLDMDFEGIDWVDQSNFDGSYKSQALQVKALIGNGWNFSNGLYLAVDWVGLAAPLTVTQSEMKGTETTFDRSLSLYRSEENSSEYKRAADKVSRSTMGTLLTLRFGFNF
jgi:hypothetical protein